MRNPVGIGLSNGELAIGQLLKECILWIGLLGGLGGEENINNIAVVISKLLSKVYLLIFRAKCILIEAIPHIKGGSQRF